MMSSLSPPDNFAMVWCGIYRSSYPNKRNYSFLRHLGLRSIVYLCPEEYPEAHVAFLAEAGIQLLQFGVVGNKEPFDESPEEIVRSALQAVIDRRNHPVLIHCNQGKHRTGCLVGCLRKAQRWSLVTVFEEYRRFAGAKARIVDEQFIERIDLSSEARVLEEQELDRDREQQAQRSSSRSSSVSRLVGAADSPDAMAAAAARAHAPSKADGCDTSSSTTASAAAAGDVAVPVG